MSKSRTLLLLLAIIWSASSCQKDKTCAIGFEGDDCDQEKTPTLVTINSITVTKFPQTTASGGGWDITNGADLTFSIVNETVGGEYVHDKLIENATIPAVFTNVNYSAGALARYSFQFYDSDNGRNAIIDPDDFLGAAVGNIWKKGTKFPKTIPIKVSALEFTLDVSYTFAP